jgi:putative ABC transport system permease protein
MVKGALFKKSVQDMKKSRSQFISIFIMAAVAMSIAAGLDSIWKTIETQSDIMYRESNLSDLWVAVANPSETKLWEVRNIAGVEKAEKRFTVNSIAQINGKPTLKVYAMPAGNTLDLPDVESGKKLSKQGAILDQSFANAHHIAAGDTVTIEINNKKIRFAVEALALSSEHIFAVKDASSLLPDPQKYGFIVVDEDRIASAYGGYKPYNQVALRLSSGADSGNVQKQLDSIFADDLIGVITRNDNRSIKMVDGKVQQFKTLATVFRPQ